MTFNNFFVLFVETKGANTPKPEKLKGEVVKYANTFKLYTTLR